MSKYTTEVRFIVETASGLKESVGYSGIKEAIRLARPSVFNFTYPIFDETYREVLETKILKHYYTREICEETVGLWKLRLDTRMNEIMPFFNKLYKSELLEFNPMYTHDLEKKHDGESSNSGNSTGSVDTTINGTGSGTNVTSGTDKYSDTPQGALSGIESNSYLTDVRITGDNATTTSTTSNVSNLDSSEVKNEETSESYLESVKGYEGANPSKLLKEYRETFLNIDMMVIDALEDLFFQLW